MESSRHLAEAATGNDADASGVEEAQAVKVIGVLVGGVGRGDGVLWEMDCWEEVH